MNDRGGIYALGFPAVSALGHLVNLAELTTLGAAAFLGVAAIAGLFGLAARRFVLAQALLREVRASFYRKLFLAFVAAVVAPVALLAVVARNFVASEMRSGVEREALRTSAAASRVVSDLIAPQAAQQGSALDDNLMVWVRRLIAEDANIFAGTELQATSERTVFASGLLSSRTPADVYVALALRREAGAVARERIGDFEYVVAAAPIRLGSVDAMMTVPLTSRQRDIDSQIDALDRRVLLAALIFILAGAGLGYTMAERIADPVSRLTRATRRIAGGDFDVRVASTSSDELARLVADFNQMASELQRQRRQLERTHRIEAWAEMARQVAHDIKNPLTPIQLNAEHLRRVHADRGEPLGPILKECVETILSQVALLRQISSEFSNFASSPSVRRAPVEVAELLKDLVAPYARALTDGLSIEVRPTPPLPPVLIDRALVARSLTNIIENALHAMPSGGRLTIEARLRDDSVAVEISDTGMGMDEEALDRVFEPYFSTKARGTGLGLPIAKRNVELSGGSIAITSQRGTRHDRRGAPAARQTVGRVSTATYAALPCRASGRRGASLVGRRRSPRRPPAGALRAPPPAAPGQPDEGRRQVAVGQHQQHDLGLGRQRRQEQRQQEQHRRAAAGLQVERLEAAEADGADHQHGRHDHDRQHRGRFPRAAEPGREREHGRRRHARCRRTGHADEVALVVAAGLDVEPRQPDGRRGHEQEPGGPSQPPQRLQAPGERQHGRRDAERHDVGQRVELEPERARGAGHPRDAPVQHVEHDRDANEERGGVELAVHRVHDAGVAAEQVGHREGAGQQVGPAADPPRVRVLSCAASAPASRASTGTLRGSFTVPPLPARRSR